MTIGRFELKLNSWTFIEYFNGARYNTPTKEFPWITLALRFPSVTLPIQRRNDWGEWESIFAISAPTLIQFSNCNDISWEGHLMILGFGISFIYQFGY
jgi:hypothetical protein